MFQRLRFMNVCSSRNRLPLLILFLFAATASATIVSHDTNGVIFNETYDDVPLGSIVNWPHSRTVSPGPGFGVTLTAGAGSLVDAIDGSAMTDPTPYQGTQAVRFVRTGGSGFGAWNSSNFVAQNFGVLTARLSLYVPSGIADDTFVASLFFANSHDDPNTLKAIYDVLGDGRITVLDTVNPDFGPDRRVVSSLPLDQWNLFSLIFDVDTYDFTGVVNGASIDGHNLNTDPGIGVSKTQVSSFWAYAGDTGAEFYTDSVNAIPELSAFALFAAVSVLVGAISARKRSRP